MVEDLIKRIAEQCAGRDRWYVMNEAEDGYCMDFGHQLDADRWMADRMRENPDYIKRNGYHIVKQRSFKPAEALANEAAARLTALESERDALLAAAGKEAVAWQVRRADGRIDGVPIQWENCTKELYDATLATGRYAGFERGPKCEVRALYDAPTPAVDTRVKPVAWTLADELARRESTCKAHLWFSDPVNTAWIPLYTDPTAALENGDGRDALESALRQIADQEHIELMLDPTWAQRIAIAALSRKTGEKDD